MQLEEHEKITIRLSLESELIRLHGIKREAGVPMVELMVNKEIENIETILKKLS